MQHSFNHFSFYSCDTTSYILLLFVLVLLDSPGNRRIIQIAFATGLSTTSGAVLFHLWHHRHVVSRVNASEYLKMASQSLWVTFSKWDNQLFTSPYRMKIRYILKKCNKVAQTGDMYPVWLFCLSLFRMPAYSNIVILLFGAVQVKWLWHCWSATERCQAIAVVCALSRLTLLSERTSSSPFSHSTAGTDSSSATHFFLYRRKTSTPKGRNSIKTVVVEKKWACCWRGRDENRPFSPPAYIVYSILWRLVVWLTLINQLAVSKMKYVKFLLTLLLCRLREKLLL